jgi:hypothetical protein
LQQKPCQPGNCQGNFDTNDKHCSKEDGAQKTGKLFFFFQSCICLKFVVIILLYEQLGVKNYCSCFYICLQILRADALLQSNQTTAIREEAEPPASTFNHLVPPKALSNGNTSHQKRTDAVEEGGSILIDTETGEARNASTGETMEMPNSSTPVVEAPPTSLYDLHQLALDADIKVALGGHNLFI